MKKIIATIIRFFMPKAVREHKREEKARRIHNANVLQGLLTLEHNIRDIYNKQNDTVYTTKKACLKALSSGLTDYNCLLGVKKADFRQIRERINDNEDEPDSLLTINPYSTNDATAYANNIPSKNPNFKILTLILLFSLQNFPSNRPNNKILVNFINLPIAKAYNQTYFLCIIMYFVHQ